MISVSELASKAMQGAALLPGEANALWTCEFDELMLWAGRVRRRFRGNAVHLCSIINAKSGDCPENCAFCAQSAYHSTGAPRYPLVDESRVKAAFERARSAGNSCFSVITSGRKLERSEVARIAAMIARLKNSHVRLSASLGELDTESLRELKASGLERFHHNLETAESHFPNVCTTHSFADRVATVRRAKEAGLEVCCGGIFGLGESRAQRVEFAFALKALDVDSVPLNFLNPIPGTPLEKQAALSPEEILRTVAVFRFVLPEKDINVCGGREVHLRDRQSWIFQAGASGMMVGGYLTTGGRDIERDLQMVNDLGFELSDKTTGKGKQW